MKDYSYSATPPFHYLDPLQIALGKKNMEIPPTSIEIFILNQPMYVSSPVSFALIQGFIQKEKKDGN